MTAPRARPTSSRSTRAPPTRTRQYLAAFGTGKSAADEGDRDPLLPRRHPVLQARQGRGRRRRVPRGRQERAGRQAPQGRAAQRDGRVRGGAPEGHRRPQAQLYPVDKKFGEAIDLYATLFPADPTLVGVIFKNGQMFYDYGEYDEAIKRFGVIVTKYPKDPNAGPAGDRILAALNKAQDYENIETWARKLKTRAVVRRARISRSASTKLIVESIQKSGDKYADGRQVREGRDVLPARAEGDHRRSEDRGAGDDERRRDVREGEAARGRRRHLPRARREVRRQERPDIAEKAAFTAGVVYEKVDLLRPRREGVRARRRRSSARAPKAADALFNAGLLRQALGQNDKAIAHYKEYAKKYASAKTRPTSRSTSAWSTRTPGRTARRCKAFARLRAHVRVDRASASSRRTSRAGRLVAQARPAQAREGGVRRPRRSCARRRPARTRRDGKPWAAEARYYEGELIFRDYEKVSLDVKPKQLERGAHEEDASCSPRPRRSTSRSSTISDLKWATAALYRDRPGLRRCSPRRSRPRPSKPPAEPHARRVPGLPGRDQRVRRPDPGQGRRGCSPPATQKAIQMQVYDEYTAKIREALGRLAAQKFPPEHESRSSERIGDRPPTPEIVTEVAR